MKFFAIALIVFTICLPLGVNDELCISELDRLRVEILGMYYRSYRINENLSRIEKEVYKKLLSGDLVKMTVVVTRDEAEKIRAIAHGD